MSPDEPKVRRIDARWQMHDKGKWGRTRMSVATRDYQLMLAVVKAADEWLKNPSNVFLDAHLEDTVNAFNAKPRSRP